MSRQLCSLLVVCSSVGAALANDAPNDSPTPEQVNANPQMYVGKTLIFDHMTMRGHPRAARWIFRLRVSTPQQTDFFPAIHGVQQLFFATPDKSNPTSNFFKSLDAKRTHSVRMTCEILKRPDRGFMASVRRMDLIRLEHLNNADVKIEEATLEDVAKEPAKYVGKTIAFDRVEFTGKKMNRPARFSLAVKSPAGTNAADFFSKEQRIIFVTADRSAKTKEYIEKESVSDRNRPLRLVCEFLKIAEGNYFASIRRIDLIGYDYDGPPSAEDAARIRIELEKKYAGVPTELGRKVELKNKVQLFYTAAITIDEAGSLGEYLEKQWKDQGYVVSIQLAKNGKAYQFRVPIKKGLERDEDCIRLYKQFAKDLSKFVFHGADVEVHLCDGKFETLLVVLPLAN